MNNQFPRSPFSPPKESLPFSGIATFAGYPFWNPDQKTDAVVLGIPYDEGTTYRPGTRFGPRQRSSLAKKAVPKIRQNRAC